jgi:hypothetical protein
MIRQAGNALERAPEIPGKEQFLRFHAENNAKENN